MRAIHVSGSRVTYGRWFARNVVGNAVDALNFICYPRGDPSENVSWEDIPIRRHEILGLYCTQSDHLGRRHGM